MSSRVSRIWERSAGRWLTALGQAQDRRERQRPVIQRSDLFDPAQRWQIFQTGEPEYIEYAAPDSPDEPAHTHGWKASSRSYPAPFALLLAPARLHGRHAVVSTISGELVLESMLGDARYLAMSSLARLHYPRSPSEALRQLLARPHLGFATPLVNLWSRGYYHWMIEGLPRLQVIEAYAQVTGRHPLLLIDPDPPPWMLDSLVLLGYSSDEWREWNYTSALVDELLLPWMPGEVGRPSPQALRWLRGRYQSALSDAAVRSAHRMYISRRNTVRRRVLNEEELLARLESLGFQGYVLEELSLEEQIRLFRRAEFILGPHGAGFANLIFAPPAARVLEFFEPGYRNSCFQHLALSLGFEYSFLLGESQGEDMKIDPDKVLRMVESMLRGGN